MAKLTFLAGLGLFCALSSVVLILFAELSQVSGSQTVLRHLQFTTVDTTNFGPALASSGVDVASLYGTGVRSGDNTGLRQFYKYGLWQACESSSASSTNDAYCTGNSWGNRFNPLQLIAADVPTALSTDVANTLGNNYFSRNAGSTLTHSAFYLFFIGAILAGLSLLTSILAHRFAFLISAITGFLAFAFFGTGAALWTAVLYRTRSAINNSGTGIHVSYGNCIWIAWAACGASLLSVVPFLLSCCFGGSKRSYDDYDEKY